MNLLISAVNTKNEKTFACLRFEEGNAFAEATIPECKITKSNGFTDEELLQLENYMLDNLATLKKRAAQINPIKSMIQD